MKYISLPKAEEYLNKKNKPYSKGYLSILARNGKLKSIKLANEWLTTEQWLSDFLKQEKEIDRGRASVSSGRGRASAKLKICILDSYQRGVFSLMSKKERERKDLRRAGLCELLKGFIKRVY